MNSSKPGAPTSAVEVIDVSPHGLWLFAAGEEHFLPFADYPWFKTASIAAAFNVREESPGNYHWPDLDVDLSLDAIRQPEKYPLIAK